LPGRIQVVRDLLLDSLRPERWSDPVPLLAEMAPEETLRAIFLPDGSASATISA